MRYQNSSNEKIEIAVVTLKETEKAYLFTDGDIEAWVPKSQVTVKVSQNSRPTLVEFPEWLAKKEGLI